MEIRKIPKVWDPKKLHIERHKQMNKSFIFFILLYAVRIVSNLAIVLRTLLLAQKTVSSAVAMRVHPADLLARTCQQLLLCVSIQLIY